MFMTFFLCTSGIIILLISYDLLWDIIDYNFPIIYDTNYDAFNELILEPILEPIFEPILENDQQKIIQILEEKIKILKERIDTAEKKNQALEEENWNLKKKYAIKDTVISSNMVINDTLKKGVILFYFGAFINVIIYAINEQ